MSFADVIKKSVLEGFSYSTLSTTQIAVTLGITMLMATYIFLVYRLVSRSTFYNPRFNISMAVISVVTAGIILAMQSNFVISLGMVGALSIVRFRTAIKDPMDLLFLFWSIGMGIVCGARMFELAILISLTVTGGLLVLQVVPSVRMPFLLVVRAERAFAEEVMLSIVKKYSPKLRIASKNITARDVNMIIEVQTKEISQLLDEVSGVDGITAVTFMYHEGEVKN